ncbi:hypothetical protein G9A89_001757, partial [Geosiphon pyriformis]
MVVPRMHGRKLLTKTMNRRGRLLMDVLGCGVQSVLIGPPATALIHIAAHPIAQVHLLRPTPSFKICAQLNLNTSLQSIVLDILILFLPVLLPLFAFTVAIALQNISLSGVNPHLEWLHTFVVASLPLFAAPALWALLGFLLGKHWWVNLLNRPTWTVATSPLAAIGLSALEPTSLTNATAASRLICNSSDATKHH